MLRLSKGAPSPILNFGVSIEIQVNGLARQVEPAATVASLLRELGLDHGHIAVELNQRIVRPSERATKALAPGDEIEIVTLVGGG